MAKYIMAHDVGTSGDKAVLVGEDGKVYGKTVYPYDIKYPQPGWAEQDPQQWWTAVTKTTRSVLEQAKVSPSDILCICFSCQMLGIVPVTRADGHLRIGIIWLDNRAPDEAMQIMNKLGGPSIFRAIAGSTIGGKDGMPKLLWLKNHEPEIYKKMECFLDTNGYLTYRCTGKMVMEWSNASVFGLDLKSKKWMTDIMKYIGLDNSKLAPLVKSIDKVGGLTKEAAVELGLLEGTPVMAGGGDGPSAATGSGAVGEGMAHANLGTSGWVGIVTSKALKAKHGVVTVQSADPGKLFLFGQMETAGACLKWVGDAVCRADQAVPSVFAYMDSNLDKISPGSDYLIFTPWMYGERAPVDDTFVRSSFLNLTPEHTREHMQRAVYEGVAYNIRWITEIFERDFKFPIPSLRIIGGGAYGKPWMKIMADVTGRKIEPVCNPQEAGAVGVAMAAAVGLGIHPNFEAVKKVVAVDHVYEPRAENKAIYDTLFCSYQEAYTSLKSFYTRLNRARCH